MLKDIAIPEMRPMNEPMIHRIIMLAFVAFVFLAAVPFVPGAEIGFALLMLFGGQIAPLVYLGMVGALLFAFLTARLVPLTSLAGLLGWLGLVRAAVFVIELDRITPEDRLKALSNIVSPSFGRRLHRYRHLVLVFALNTPGNSLLGGGGGLAFLAGASGLYPFWQYLAVILFAVAPVPLFFFVVA